jgi:hypothetical protein
LYTTPGSGQIKTKNILICRAPFRIVFQNWKNLPPFVKSEEFIPIPFRYRVIPAPTFSAHAFINTAPQPVAPSSNILPEPFD